jgi:HSP20 family protein
MAIDLVPSSFWRFPTMRSIWDDEDDLSISSTPSGISISEDDTHVYVDVALPGVDPKDVDITFDKGMLWVKGEVKEEEKGKKYYRKATSSFSYRVAVPGDLDITQEPEAKPWHGMMRVTFTKSKASMPKKIAVKS